MALSGRQSLPVAQIAIATINNGIVFELYLEKARDSVSDSNMAQSSQPKRNTRRPLHLKDFV